MLYGEIFAVCSEIHTKHINTLFEQKVKFIIDKPGGQPSLKVSKAQANGNWK